MKRTYEEANLDIIVFNSYKTADILTASPSDPGEEASIDIIDDTL